MNDYNQALKQLNDTENVYGREIGTLNRTIDNDEIEKNDLRNDIQNLENTIQETLNEIEKLKNISKKDKKDIKILVAKIYDIIDDNDKLEDFIELYNNIIKEDQYKIYNKLYKFKNNMESDMHDFDKKFTIKENKLHAKLDKLTNDVKKLNKYTKNNNEKINTKKV